MSLQVPLSERNRTPLELVGSYVEAYWCSTSRLAKRQCDKCVYLVRGNAPGMVCLELVYDAIDGEHRQDHIYWVPTDSIQYLRPLTEKAAQHRIDRLEREMADDKPRD
jgi:hypothetical protein